jgi:hypothetical protein
MRAVQVEVRPRGAEAKTPTLGTGAKICPADRTFSQDIAPERSKPWQRVSHPRINLRVGDAWAAGGVYVRACRRYAGVFWASGVLSPGKAAR